MQLKLPSATFKIEPIGSTGGSAASSAIVEPGARFCARMRLLHGDAAQLAWEVETDSRDAKAAVLADIEKQAAELGTQFAAVVAALMQELKIKESQAIGLALALTFPLTLLGSKARLMDARPKQRGRPRYVDKVTKKVGMLAAAWLRTTGRLPGTTARAQFVRALDAIKDFLPLRCRDGKVIDDMSQFLRMERAKLMADDVDVLVPHNSLAEQLIHSPRTN
jgi:hypothetical protein